MLRQSFWHTNLWNWHTDIQVVLLDGKNSSYGNLQTPMSWSFPEYITTRLQKYIPQTTLPSCNLARCAASGATGSDVASSGDGAVSGQGLTTEAMEQSPKACYAHHVKPQGCWWGRYVALAHVGRLRMSWLRTFLWSFACLLCLFLPCTTRRRGYIWDGSHLKGF